ncbi:DUF4189 domain-containing protein [Brevundimonas sp. GN22]
MKMLLHVATIIAAAALFIISYPLDAHAQTQCPVGTAAGSATCGPDPSSGGYAPAAPSGPPRIRERVSGVGGFAINTETFDIYAWTGHSYRAEDAGWQALAKCQQPDYNRELSMAPPPNPDAKCEILYSWLNGCASVARGSVEGIDNYYFEYGRDMRAARAATLSACEGKATGCTIVHDARCASATNRTREVIMLGRQD